MKNIILAKMQEKSEKRKVKNTLRKCILFFLFSLFSLLFSLPLAAEDAQFYFERGESYLDEGELDLAIEAFSRAIELNPDWAEPWNSRGSTYIHLWLQTFEDFVLDLAIKDYSQAIVLDPNNADVWGNWGWAYMGKGELDRAIENFNQAIVLDPENADFWSYRGYAYREKGELDRAIDDYSQVIALDPEDFNTWNSRGYAYRDKGELDRAIEDLSQAIALNSDWANTWNSRGLIYRDKGEFDRAIEDYSQAISLYPDWVFPWNNRGLAFLAKGELDRAVEDFNQVIAVDPDYANIWNSRGIAFSAKGELDRAIDDYSQAITLDPDFAKAWNNRGLAYRDKGDLDQAIQDLSQSIAIASDLVDAWFNRGTVYYAKGELNQAIGDFRQSIEVADGSNNILDIFHLSWQFAGYLYENYPFLEDIIFENAFYAQRADLVREALGCSIARAENARSTLGARGAGIMTGLLYQYYAAVDFEIHFGSTERAFAFSEGLRSRGFLEQMGTEAALKLPGIDPGDAQSVRDLVREIGNLQDLLAALDPQREAERFASTGIALSRAEQALAALDGRISAEVPQYAVLRNPSIASLAQAQAFSGDDRVILQYVIWDSSVEFNAPATASKQSSYQDRPSINSYCLVITKDGITSVRLDPHFDYAANVNNLRSRLLRVREGIVPSEVTFETYRNELYNALIKPVLEHIPSNIKNILIVPDSNLTFLPFDILRENLNSPNLGEQFNISLSPSVSVSILSKQHDIPYSEPIIAFGGVWYNPGDEERSVIRLDVDSRLAALDRQIEEEETRGMVAEVLLERTQAVDFFNIERNRWTYLAGATEEVLGLEGITNVEPSILLGGEASMHNVKELSLDGTLLNYPIIHFALHGFFNDNLIPQAALVFSEYSGLLGDKSEEDGFLSIEDIALLQLNARMVTLSACETGIGRINRGDGMSGLARAFMVAGAQNVGVSLWKISDRATVDFMLGVYGKVIGQGKSFRDAYSEMKAEFRNSERWSHPYYWAGFTLYE